MLCARKSVEMAVSLGIPLSEVCARAKIARSTPARWMNGAKPRQHLVRRFHAAMLELAQPGLFVSSDIDVALAEIAAARSFLDRAEAALRAMPR